MKPFDENAECCKCGHPNIGTLWMQLSGKVSPDRLCRSSHLQRTCLRCGYRWPEIPLDRIQTQPAEDLGGAD